jgi:hypothetical protein
MVLVAAPLLVHVVEMRNVERLHTALLCLLRLQWLLASKILHEKLWLQWICC